MSDLFAYRVKSDLKRNKLRLKDLAQTLNVNKQRLYYMINNENLKLKDMIAINRAMMTLCKITYSIEDYADVLEND